MAQLVDVWWAILVAGGGDGGHSSTITWRFGREFAVRASVAMTGHGGGDGHVTEVGFSGFVKDGEYHRIGDDRYSTLSPVVFMDGISEIEMTARSYDAWVKGQGTDLLFA